MADTNPLRDVTPLQPPAHPLRPLVQVMLSVVIVVVCRLAFPDWLDSVFITCVFYDLALGAAHLAALIRWALAVQKLIEQTQVDGQPYR